MNKIWMCWFQGESNAPLLVKNCINSWRDKNPQWEVCVVDFDSMYELVGDIITGDVRDKIGENYAALSDLLRISLLYKYGGVWADATVYCLSPLDSWLHEASPEQFFCFDNSHKDKTASSWFLYSSQYNPIITTWLYKSIEYWGSFERTPKLYRKKQNQEIYKFLEVRGISWFDSIIVNDFNVFPYFWFHMILDEKVLIHKYLSSIYNSKKSLKSSLVTRSHLMKESISEQDRININESRVPMFKLTYKFSRENISNTSYAALFEKNYN